MDINIQSMCTSPKQLSKPLHVPVAEVRGPPQTHIQSHNQLQSATTTVNVPGSSSIDLTTESKSSAALLSSNSVSIVEKTSSSSIATSSSSSRKDLNQHQQINSSNNSIVLPTSAKELCDVCCEYKPRNLLRGCSDCKHRYCASCVDKYWTGAIYSGNHSRLLCMYGGCGVLATDADVAAVVSHRAYRKMLFFRSRDAYNHIPGARWCAVDLCWEYLGAIGPGSHSNSNNNISSSTTTEANNIANTLDINTNRNQIDSGNGIVSTKRKFPLATSRSSASPISSSTSSIVSCHRCHGKTCLKCEREVLSSSTVHICASRKSNKAHTAMFGMWAMLHTKACPACAARIQRNHGCSHMTCTRCSSYFCWRCKGFLNNGCPLPGRACICDRVMTAAAYSGLAVAGVVGSPLILGAAVLAGPPYLVYRAAKLHRTKSHRSSDPNHRYHDVGAPSSHLGNGSLNSPFASYTHTRAITRGLVGDDYNDDRFDTGNNHFNRFSDVFIDDSRIGISSAGPRLTGRSRPNLRSTPADVPRLVLSSSSFPSSPSISPGVITSDSDSKSSTINADNIVVDELDYEERVDSGSLGFRSFRDILVTESRRGDTSADTVIKRTRSPRKNSRLDLTRVTSAATASTNNSASFKHFHTRSNRNSNEDSSKFHGNEMGKDVQDRPTAEFANLNRRNDHSIIVVEGRGVPYNKGSSHLSLSDDDTPNISVEACSAAKSFALERRRVSFGGGRSIRRHVV